MEQTGVTLTVLYYDDQTSCDKLNGGIDSDVISCDVSSGLMTIVTLLTAA